MRVAIIGAGLAGLACAERLTAAGHRVALFDKGSRPGGRMSVRRLATVLGDARFDHGAQYFTARDAGFRARVDEWGRAGLAAPWPAAGPDAWVGTPGMDAPVRDLAGRHDVLWSARVDAALSDAGGWRLGGEGVPGERFDAALAALPAEQAAALLAPAAPEMAARAAATPSQPCWTVMAAFAERLPVGADVLREEGVIGWAARNSAKPGRSGPEGWVVQAGPEWSRRHLEDNPDAVTAALLRALAERAGAALPAPLATAAHRWRYARSGQAGEGALWNASLGLGACGDWLLGPRIESAWLSGQALAEAVIDTAGGAEPDQAARESRVS